MRFAPSHPEHRVPTSSLAFLRGIITECLLQWPDQTQMSNRSICPSRDVTTSRVQRPSTTATKKEYIEAEHPFSTRSLHYRVI